jgi:type VI secretion system protein VasJ
MWGKALSEDAPCGEDCAFSPEFERLRIEVDKDASLYGLAATDWKLVAQIAANILTSQSKELWVLVYAVYAEYRLHGFAACPPAFTALADILDTWWDSLYPSPQRLKRRLAPLTWLCGRMEHQAQVTCFMDGSSEAVQELRGIFARIQDLLREKAGDDIPSFPGVFAKIPEASQAPNGPAAAENTAGQSPQSGGGAGQGESRPPVWDKAGTDLGGRIPVATLPPLIRGIIDQTRQLAEHFLALNPKDARAYRLHRLGMWDTLLQAPLADADGKTQIGSGVPQDLVKSYAAAVEAGQYADTLPYLERAAGKSPFWFEGHAWVYRCLEGLGANEAATSVKEALGSLLRRFPELLTYKFRANIPFAPPAVLPWLESLRLPGGAGKDRAISGARVGGGDAPSAALLQEALERGKEEGFEAGLRLLGSAPATRSRPAVLHGLTQARYCLLAGKSAVAAQVLFALYERLEQWNLLDWEPELTADILSLLLHSQARQNDARTQEMLRRLHWLNLDAALDLSRET